MRNCLSFRFEPAHCRYGSQESGAEGNVTSLRFALSVSPVGFSGVYWLKRGEDNDLLSMNAGENVKLMGAAEGIHVVAKPAGPVCNLNCEYCFYLEKQALFGTGGQYRMSDSVLSAFITNYVNSQPSPVVEFVWQGGEPTLQGEDFFKRVVELQKPF